MAEKERRRRDASALSSSVRTQDEKKEANHFICHTAVDAGRANPGTPIRFAADRGDWW
jgi:hypothetical protein